MTIYIVFKDCWYRDFGDLYSDHTPKKKSFGFKPEKVFKSMRQAQDYVSLKSGRGGNVRVVRKFSFDEGDV